jgi:hypothetical protein
VTGQISPRQPQYRALRSLAGAAGLAEVVGCHAGQFTEMVAEPGTQRGGALSDRVQAQVEGLPDGCAQAQHADVAVLPGGEPAGAADPGETPVSVPGRRADLGDERVEPVQRGGADPQEPRPPADRAGTCGRCR